MALHRRNDRAEFLNPSGAPPRLKVQRGDDGRLEVIPPEGDPRHPGTQPDERPPQPPDPRPNVSPDVAGL